MAEKNVAQLRAAFAGERARRILAGIDGCPLSSHTETREPTRQLSERVAYFSDKDTLAVTYRPGEWAGGLALAHGLYQAGSRRLVLVAPTGEAETTAQRIPWLVSPIELWVYDNDNNASRVRCGKEQAMDAISDVLETNAHDLGDRKTWVEPLLKWAEKANLAEAHRKSYLAWHCQGRMVLRIWRGRGSVKVTAGVNYSTPREDRPTPTEDEFAGPAPETAIAALISAADRAVRNRRSGEDDENAEHRMQAALETAPEKIGVVAMFREFPAIRKGRRAYVDFLAVDDSKRLHVVETKIGHDNEIVLQALDYWIWAKKHLTELSEHLDADHDVAPCIDFVIQRKGSDRELLDCYSRCLVKALHDVPWCVHEVREIDGEVLVDRLSSEAAE